ncbi:MAG: DUF1844 domain-containing protein [Desulfobacterales bacterium]|nr:DUF1844 domain-containing protein [Desulfobacterales bacterium]
MAEGNGFVMKEGTAEKSTSPKAFKVDFSSFILSLYSSALVQLGKIEDPISGEKIKNIDIARQTIDIIAVLKEKTQGNLDTEEEKLMNTLLQELRIAFVEAKS